MAAEVKIIFKGDNQAKAASKDIAGDLDNVGKAADSAGQKTEGFFKGMLQHAGGFITANVLGRITDGIGGVAKAMIGGNAEFESYNSQFTVLLKSSDAAKQRLKELADFGASTPFELPEVVRADKILQGFGLHSQEAAEKFKFSGEEIRTIAGDVASGTGASFEEMALLIGKFSSGATGEAISRMQEMGITTREELTKMGLEFSKSGQLLSPLPQSMETVLKLMKDKYGGLMDVQSRTFSGMMSNLQDWIGGTLRTIGQPVFEVLKDKLAGLLKFLSEPSTQQAITNFAKGLASAMGVLLDIAKIIIDNAKPAFIALAAATTAYAIVSLPTLITAITGTITAFGAQATAAMASLGPYALIAAAVYGVVKAYDSLNDKIDSYTKKLLESRQWWVDGAKALDRYTAASDDVKAAVKDKADALQALMKVQEDELSSIDDRLAKHLISKAQAVEETQAINARIEALKGATQALNDDIQVAEQGVNVSNAMGGAIKNLVTDYQKATGQIALTKEEQEKFNKELEKLGTEGVNALHNVVDAENNFLQDREKAHAEHEDRLAKLVEERTKARMRGATAAEQQGIQDRINEEIAGFQTSEKEAALSYARQQAANRAHLGQILMDTVIAESALNGVSKEKRDELLAGISATYGTQRDIIAESFDGMKQEIHGWAENHGANTKIVLRDLEATGNKALETQQAMDKLNGNYTATLTQNFLDGKIAAEQLTKELGKIPAQVYSEVHVHTRYTSSGDAGTNAPSGGRTPDSGRIPQARASGGAVRRGQMYLVGDNPDGTPNATSEIFVPGQDGTIIPSGPTGELLSQNKNFSSGVSIGGITVNVHNPIIDTATKLQDMAEQIKASVTEGILHALGEGINAFAQEGIQ